MDYFNEHDGDPEWDQWNIVFAGPMEHPELFAAWVDMAMHAAVDRFDDIPNCEFVGGRDFYGDLVIRWWFRVDSVAPEGTTRSLRFECTVCSWTSATTYGWVGDESTDADRQAQYEEATNHPFQAGWAHEPRRIDLVAHPGAEHRFNRAGGERCVCGERVPAGD